MKKTSIVHPLISFCSCLTANRLAQLLLQNGVTFAQYLQGIGSGSNAASSGEIAVFSKLTQNSQRALCIFDVGANKGQFLTLACSCLDGRQFHVYSFEPCERTYKELCQKVNGRHNVTLKNCALGKTTGEVELFYDSVGSGLSSLTKRRLTHFGVQMEMSEKVKIATLDEFCDDHQIEYIDLLKIDVEGHELDVLYGGSRMFRNSAIGMVTFEFGGCNIDTRTFFQDFFYYFEAQKMRIARITPSGYLYDLSSYREVLEQFRTTNFLCYRP